MLLSVLPDLNHVRALIIFCSAGLVTAVLNGSGGAPSLQASMQAHASLDLCPDSSANAAGRALDSGVSCCDNLSWEVAWSGQQGAESGTADADTTVDDLAADLLAALLQLPASGPLVLRAAASRLLACKEDVLESSPRHVCNACQPSVILDPAICLLAAVMS